MNADPPIGLGRKPDQYSNTALILIFLSEKKGILMANEMGKIIRETIYDNLDKYKRYGAQNFQEYANKSLRLLYRKHEMFSGQIKDHCFVILNSARQIWWLAPRNRYKLFKACNKMKEKIENLLPKDPELADLVEKCQVDLVAQRASSYRKSSSLKRALGKVGVDYDDNALYSKVYYWYRIIRLNHLFSLHNEHCYIP